MLQFPISSQLGLRSAAKLIREVLRKSWADVCVMTQVALEAAKIQYPCSIPQGPRKEPRIESQIIAIPFLHPSEAVAEDVPIWTIQTLKLLRRSLAAERAEPWPWLVRWKNDDNDDDSNNHKTSTSGEEF